MVRDLEIPCKSDLGSLAWKGYPNQRYEPKAEQKETKATIEASRPTIACCLLPLALSSKRRANQPWHVGRSVGDTHTRFLHGRDLTVGSAASP